jgi:uncharacterized protein (DUF2062 family)
MKLRNNRLVRLMVELLSQGITPHKVAVTVCLGLLFGVMPLIGASTILCTLVALAFGLNLALIQVVNQLVYPLQILLLIPFVQAGQWLFRQPPLPLSLAQVTAIVRAGLWQAVASLWVYTLHGLVAWVILGGFGAGLVYALSLPVLKRLVPAQPVPVNGG